METKHVVAIGVIGFLLITAWFAYSLIGIIQETNQNLNNRINQTFENTNRVINHTDTVVLNANTILANTNGVVLKTDTATNNITNSLMATENELKEARKDISKISALSQK